jgi:hypothetical protein
MKVLLIGGTGLISEAVSRPDYIDGLLGTKRNRQMDRIIAAYLYGGDD